MLDRKQFKLKYQILKAFIFEKIQVLCQFLKHFLLTQLIIISITTFILITEVSMDNYQQKIKQKSSESILFSFRNKINC